MSLNALGPVISDQNDMAVLHLDCAVIVDIDDGKFMHNS